MHSFRFNAVHDIVREEVLAVQSSVGLSEVSGFNRIEITGSGTHDFLDRMSCGSVTRKVGRVGLCYLLNDRGMIKAEATVANIPGRTARIWYGSAAAAEQHDMDWLVAHRKPDEDVEFRSLTNEWTTLVLAGPRARDVLSGASRGDWSREAFPWLSVREAFVGIAPAVVLSVSFSGELAYEIHVPNNQLYPAYLALRKAGESYGMRLFGSRAIESMRLEKGFLHWKSDLLTEFDPFETGLDRFVRLGKGSFVGDVALRERSERGPMRRLVTLRIDCDDRPAHAGASAMSGDRVIGTVTSGAWGHRTNLNLAYAFVEPDHAGHGTTIEVDLLGERFVGEVIAPCPYDPDFELLRS